MLRIILREVLIFVCCLAVFPAVMLAVLFQSDSPDAGMRLLARTVLTTQVISPAGTLVIIGIRLLTPYLLVQAIRAYFWSAISPRARRWANFYYMLLLGSVGAWTFWRAWDLFYFMYALGDMPAEIRQFLELEGKNVAIFVVCTVLAVHCLRVFLNPAGGRAGPREKGA